MKTLLKRLITLGVVGLGVWLSIWVMLYGGIMQAVNNWGVDNSVVVWGIIRAALFEVGLIPLYLLIAFTANKYFWRSWR